MSASPGHLRFSPDCSPAVWRIARGARHPRRQVVRFQVSPPEHGSFGADTGVGRADGTSGGTLSPDGTQLAFVAEQSGRTQLWLRRMDAFASRPLAGTDDGWMSFWSPDGRAIGFFAGGKLKRMDCGRFDTDSL